MTTLASLPHFLTLDLCIFVGLTATIAICAFLGAHYHGPSVAGGKEPHATSYDDAKAALDRMKDWAVWLVGIQTGAMGLIGYAFKSELTGSLKNWHISFAILSVAFLAVSTFSFGWLLAAFPSVQQRLKHTDANQQNPSNDIYSISLFKTFSVRMNVQFAACCAHWLGIVGFFCFAAFFVVGVIGEL